MKKKLSAVLAAALALSMLSGCSNTNALPDDVDQDAMADAAQAIVDQLADGQYQAVADAFRDDLQQTYSITAQTVEDLMSTLEEAGAYVSTKEFMISDGDNDDFDEPYAVVTIYCEHEEDDVLYEVSLDLDLQLIGLTAKEK